MFVYFNEEWNGKEETKTSKANPSGMARSVEDANSDKEQEKISKKT